MFDFTIPDVFAMQVMQSSEYADEIIKYFKEAVFIAGIEPQEALNLAVRATGARKEDLTEDDLKMIQREVDIVCANLK